MRYPNGTTTRPGISSPFGPRSGGAFGTHYGTDFIGFTAIRAIAAGLVTFAGWMNGSAGHTIAIDHGNGVTSVYMHNAAHQIKRGQRVAEGQRIATMGSSGNATGNCNHLEIRLHGTSVDPVPYIAARLTTSGGNAAGSEDDMFSDTDRALLKEVRTELMNTKAGVWTGGVSNGKKFNYGILPIVAHNQTLIARQTTEISALTAAMQAIAAASGADPAAILKAVQEGVRTAMDGMTFTIDA